MNIQYPHEKKFFNHAESSRGHLPIKTTCARFEPWSSSISIQPAIHETNRSQQLVDQQDYFQVKGGEEEHSSAPRNVCQLHRGPLPTFRQTKLRRPDIPEAQERFKFRSTPI